jgi:hypothetical protein
MITLKILPEYSIDSFNWVKEENTFYGIDIRLWERTGSYQYPFPNDRKQFKIFNPKTGGFRVFTFMKEFDSTESGMKEYLFTSEDGIDCVILICPNPEYPEFDVE